MPVLVLGGEAFFAPASAQRDAFDPVVANLETAVIPKAGHWTGDENPLWTANKALQFFGNRTSVPTVDLSWLEDTITLFGGINGGMSPLTPRTNDTA